MPRMINIKKMIALFIFSTFAILGFSGTSFAGDGGGSGVNWDAVAHCESTGNWSNADTGGNGHYGGLQFSPSSWAAAGGTKYASMPHHASKAQQIATAERLYDMQGPGAWACPVTYGGKSYDTPETAQQTQNSQQQGTNNSQQLNTQQQNTSSGKSQKHSQDSNVQQVQQHSSSSQSSGETYTVVSGDTLGEIASEHGTTVQELALKSGIGNVDLIYPGQVLEL